jgi:hypothetical protein
MNTSAYWCAVDLELSTSILQLLFFLFRSLESLIFARLEMAAGKYQESYSLLEDESSTHHCKEGWHDYLNSVTLLFIL